jgi:hypothetical protein
MHGSYIVSTAKCSVGLAPLAQASGPVLVCYLAVLQACLQSKKAFYKIRYSPGVKSGAFLCLGVWGCVVLIIC